MPHRGLLLFYGIKELQEVSPQTHKVNAAMVRTLKNNNHATDMRTLNNQRSYSQSSYLSKSGIFIISNQTYKRVMTYDMRTTNKHIERYLYFKLNQ